MAKQTPKNITQERAARRFHQNLDGVDVELGLAPVEAAAEEWKG
jgi:hypothetical protein